MKDCPGLYCGRFKLPDGNLSICGACPRGSRTIIDQDMCLPCQDEPTFYDWLFLIFMAMMPLFYHWYYIEFHTFSYKINSTTLSKKLITSAILEVTLSAVFTVLLMEPMWSFKLYACRINSISDWYTFMYNPSPRYEDYIYCTQEIVYPFYTMIFVFYGFGVISLLAIRPWFIDSKNTDYVGGLGTVYAGLYLYPTLALLHAVACGFIYYMFPYLVIIVSVISNAVHFAMKINQSMGYLIRNTVTSSRNMIIVLIHWLCHAFGIIGITELRDPTKHYFLLCLVPVPTLFYILTSRLTDPRKVHSD